MSTFSSYAEVTAQDFAQAYRDTCSINVLAGNAGNGGWAAAKHQLKIMRDEWEELESGVDTADLRETRDGLADLLFTLIGFAHRTGLPVVADLIEVVRSNWTKFDDTEEDAIKTQAKYQAQGLVTAYTRELWMGRDEAPRAYYVTRSAQDQSLMVGGKLKQFPKGKWLKSFRFQDTDFLPLKDTNRLGGAAPEVDEDDNAVVAATLPNAAMTVHYVKDEEILGTIKEMMPMGEAMASIKNDVANVGHVTDATRDQIASVMLQHGTPEQKAEVLASISHGTVQQAEALAYAHGEVPSTSESPSSLIIQVLRRDTIKAHAFVGFIADAVKFYINNFSEVILSNVALEASAWRGASQFYHLLTMGEPAVPLLKARSTYDSMISPHELARGWKKILGHENSETRMVLIQVAKLSKEFAADDEFTVGWHSNLAMALYDGNRWAKEQFSELSDPRLADAENPGASAGELYNRAAGFVLNLLFGIDTLVAYQRLTHAST